MGFISIIGGFYLGYMAYESFKTRGLTEDVEIEEPKSFRKGATVNFLNPSPYLFWITIGGPIIINAYNESILSPLLFLIGFYAFLVGSKIVLAYGTDKSRDFLTGKTYIYTMRVLGIIILIFALYFLNQGIQLLIK